jgi:hypothetical protein
LLYADVVAEILRDCFAQTAGAEPEVLAYHFTQGGMTDSAVEWWGKAGDQALRRSAFQVQHPDFVVAADERTGSCRRPEPGVTLSVVFDPTNFRPQK